MTAVDHRFASLGIALAWAVASVAPAAPPRCPVVDTMQDRCFDERAPLTPPAAGERFFGQDAQHAGLAAAYRDNGDGTVTDLQTGLTWSKAVNEEKATRAEAERQAKALALGGHRDWRVPTIKELYSLIDFRGVTGAATRDAMDTVPRSAVPYLDTDFFDFRYGQTNRGERYIDAQWVSSTRYAGVTMEGTPTVFGVNFADGRIKGYPDDGRKKYYVRFVRGPAYGNNDFADNGDGTISDRATGLQWARADSGAAMTWEQALAYVERLRLAGHDDWRLPNAKELQSIVDYTRSPDTTDSPAIAPVFETTAIRNEADQRDWPYFWTSTTHLDGPDAGQAVYVAFGRAIGSLRGRIMDVHGAGAQRSDPKTGAARLGHGPQGDAQRVRNFVRAVRGGPPGAPPESPSADRYPNTVRVGTERYRPEPMTFQRSPRRETEDVGLSPGRRPPDGAAGFIRRLDRDGDGRVSGTEFDGPAEGFRRFDRNGDGYLTTDEAPAGPPERR